ncbi:MAG: YybS family protein [Nitrospirota bacterium]|nr:YybS family protein [Nitrospirota bacterium]
MQGTWLEAAASLFLSLLLFSAVRVLWPVGMPLALFAPAPLAVLCLRRGEPVLLGAVAAGAAFQWLLGGGGSAAAFLVSAAVPALLIARGMAFRWRPELVVGGIAVLVTGATLGAFEVAVPGGMKAWSGGFVDGIIAQYQTVKPGDPALAMLRENAAEIARTLYLFAPITFMWTGIMLGAASLLIVRNFFTRNPHPVVGDLPPLLEWYLPDGWVWVLIAAGVPVALGAMGISVPLEALVVGGNVLGVLVLVYALQGWAVVAWQFAERDIHPALQVAFYAVLLIQPVLVLLLTVLGVLDMRTDTRRVRPENMPPPAPQEPPAES